MVIARVVERYGKKTFQSSRKAGAVLEVGSRVRQTGESASGQSPFVGTVVGTFGVPVEGSCDDSTVGLMWSNVV